MSIIKGSMTFDTFDDFYERRMCIKKRFNESNETYKEVYKLYIFANRVLTMQKAELIWEFLVEPVDSEFSVKNKDLERLYKSKVVKKWI